MVPWKHILLGKLVLTIIGMMGVSGVESYDINMEEQKVTVKCNLQPEAVLQIVSKTGKKTSFFEDAATAAAPAAPAEPETKSTETETKLTEEVAAP